ncbi:MAG: cytochrome c-type biogenesis protein [Pseudomonadales bacterium]
MRYFLMCLLLLCCSTLQASIDAYEFKSEEQRNLYQKLTEELRCPKCQNQNLADSDSQIAADLRKELYQQLLAGKSENEIIDFMRERYGDFVLYKPRMQLTTVFLWAAPISLILIVMLLLWFSRRGEAVVVEQSALSESVVNDADQKIFAGRWVNFVSLLILVAVAIGSLLLYKHVGSVRALQITELGQAVFSQQLSAEEQEHQQKTSSRNWMLGWKIILTMMVLSTCERGCYRCQVIGIVQ